MKPEEIDALTAKKWIIRFVQMPAEQLTAEIARRKGGQWYRLSSGRLLLGKDYGGGLTPGCEKIGWPDPVPDDYLLDTDSYPDWANDANAAIRLGLELREQYGDPYRLNMEMDENNRKRWLAIFRKSHAYAWGDSPAEAMCRAYLLALELLED